MECVIIERVNLARDTCAYNKYYTCSTAVGATIDTIPYGATALEHVRSAPVLWLQHAKNTLGAARGPRGPHLAIPAEERALDVEEATVKGSSVENGPSTVATFRYGMGHKKVPVFC